MARPIERTAWKLLKQAGLESTTFVLPLKMLYLIRNQIILNKLRFPLHKQKKGLRGWGAGGAASHKYKEDTIVCIIKTYSVFQVLNQLQYFLGF
jgi:hypothetical protein